MQAAPELLGAPTVGGGSARPGGGGGEFIEVIYTLQPYEVAKNGEKTAGFADVLAYKSQKRRFSL